MFIVTFLGRIFLTMAVALMGLGAWLWLSGQDILKPAGALWFELDAFSLNFSQAIIQRYISHGLWDNVIVPQLLLRPAWEALSWLFLIMVVIAALLLWPGRGRRRQNRLFD